jgi:hypothetical protein
VDHDGPFRFLVDSGSPLTLLDTDSFAVEDGQRDIDLDAFGLQFPAYPTAALDVFSFTQDDGSDFDGIPAGPKGLEAVDRYPALLAEMMRRGWSDADVAKLAGLNMLRVMEQVEAVAAKH